MLEKSQLDSKVEYSKTNLYKQTVNLKNVWFDSHLPHKPSIFGRMVMHLTFNQGSEWTT